jgi:hypothetical protein
LQGLSFWRAQWTRQQAERPCASLWAISADELRRFPVSLEGDDVLVDLSPPYDPVGHQRKRLRDGLERDIPLVLAKATIALLEADPSGVEVFRAGLDFGVARRGGGWFRGLTSLTCFMNLDVEVVPGIGFAPGLLRRLDRCPAEQP